MASETPGKNGTLWLFAPVQSGSPPSRALDFHCHHRKHSATTNFQQATSASPGVPQRWKQHTWLHWGARNIFTLHIQKIENGYLPKLTHSPASQDHLCSPYLLHPSEVCLLQGIDSWLCKSSCLARESMIGGLEESASMTKYHNILPGGFFWAIFLASKRIGFFFSKRTTKSFPTTVSRLKLYFGCGPPNQNEGYYKGSP